MAIQLGTTVRNARLDVIETTIGSSPAPHLKIRAGTAPGNCAAADGAGTLLVDMTLPADFWNDAASAQKTLKGTWSVTASGAGTATHFRIYDAATGATCLMQGTVGLASGDLQLDNNVIAGGQVVTITGFTLQDGNP